MSTLLKAICGAIALGLAVYSYIDKNNRVGIYWSVVSLYWLANIFT